MMRKTFVCNTIIFSLVNGNAIAFFVPGRIVEANRKIGLSISYLESLETLNGVAQPSTPSYSNTSNEDESVESAPSFSYAPIDYFNVENMRSKGPRTTANWGSPQDSTRMLVDDGSFRVGSWYCTEGGWPSLNPKAHTEIFYVLSGHGALGDDDLTMHYFGPGDTVIIPKGHTGRWDVLQPIHKIWAVNDHEKVEDPFLPIRVAVEHYHTFAPEHMVASTLFGSTDEGKGRTFYDIGPTKVGVWSCDSGSSFSTSNGTKRIFLHVLEGAMFITNTLDGNAKRCVAGDTVMLPAGFSGHIDVIEATRLMWTIAE